MKATAIAALLLAGAIAAAQSKPDTDSIRKILDDEISTWNQGDANGYAKHFAGDGTFTNVRGMFFTGQQAFRDRHEVIFKGPMQGTKLQIQVVSLRFLKPDVAICESLSWVSDFKSPPPNLYLDAKGRLRTRLLQVLEKRSGEWQIVVYHNIDMKPDADAPEPK